jgi:predicted nucleic acid-binding protein
VTLVDTNVLLDLVTDNADWAEWSQRQLEAAAVRGPVLTRDVRRYRSYFPTVRLIAPAG